MHNHGTPLVVEEEIPIQDLEGDVDLDTPAVASDLQGDVDHGTAPAVASGGEEIPSGSPATLPPILKQEISIDMN